MRSSSVRALAVCALVSVLTLVPRADTSVQTLPFSQNWSNTGLITSDDDWGGVAGIVGYRGDGMASATGVNPQIVIAEGGNVVDVNANQTNPNTFTSGGVTEFHIPDPVVALNGSGTARAPHIVISVNTTANTNIRVAYNLRDLDGSTDNSVQPVALQYRVGTTGNFTNVPAGFIADASSGPSLATLVTPVNVVLPAAAANQPVVQIRVITTDAVGNDEWIGVDDLTISGTPTGDTAPSVSTTAPAANAINVPIDSTVAINFSETVNATAGAFSFVCGGAPQAFTTSTSPAASFTLVPTAPLPHNATCTVTVEAAQVTDVDSDDPPDTLAANYAFSFTTTGGPTPPAGSGSATPASVRAGKTTLLSVTATGGTNPASGALFVTGDLSSIGGSAVQGFQSGGGNTFTFNALVAAGTPPGAKLLPITVSDSENRSGTFNLQVQVTPPLADSTVVINQVYGGGGNTNSTYLNDYVQLYNRGTTTVDLAGWSLQYASATGTSWSNRQPLGGTIAPGQYLLVSLATGVEGDGAALPPANIYGEINLSGTTGKIALVDNYDFLTGACPVGNPHIKDFVGYGSNASCREGSANAPAPSNTTAITRKIEEDVVDTNENGADFAAGAPNPFRDAPIVELGPQVIGTDPQSGSTIAPRDATIEVNFTEPVNVSGAWFGITCTSTGLHTSVTTAAHGTSHYITPNDTFAPGESCTVTVYKDQVSDVDTDDSAANTDTLPADYVWTFSVATGDAPPYPSSVHLALGNPTGAVPDTNVPANYLMEKPEFSLSYNRDDGRPNWVSWHLSAEWVGTLQRLDTFRADPALPPDWYRVQSFDFQNSGFDRGHLVPNADRDVLTARPTNQATFLMTNMLAQAPDNNQGPWANLENYLRTLLGTTANPTNELYIVAGGWGVGGTGSDGPATTIANGKVKVPAFTWKVALVLPAAVGDDAARVSCSTRTIAVIMPNTQGIRTNPNDASDWQNYLTTVDMVETLTGYDFFANVPEPYQRCVEAGINGANPPLVKGEQAIAFAPLADRGYDAPPFTVSATGGLSGNPVTFAASGACTATGVNGSTITLVSLGACTITASQAGSTIYEAAPDVTQTFTVVDAIVPVISNVTATPGVLGPPNHKMIDVTIAYSVTDVTAAQCALTVESNESQNAEGDGNTAIDWQVIDAHHVKLRAERAGGGTGRIYTVTVRCTDTSGNVSTAIGSVTVAK